MWLDNCRIFTGAGPNGLNKVDENGYVLETAVFDQDDEYLGGKNVPVTQFEYDEHGAVVKIKNMDKDRNLINDPENGIAITEYRV